MTARRGAGAALSGPWPPWNPLTLAALGGLWLAGLPNRALWHALLGLPEMATVRGHVFAIGLGLMIAALLTALLSLAAWRLTIKPVLAVLIVAAALGAHFMDSYGVAIDRTMMVNVLQTSPREVRELLNLRFVATLVVLAGLPLALLWKLPVQRLGLRPQLVRNALGGAAALLLLAALVFVGYADLSATMRNHRTLRYLVNPVNSLWSLGQIGVGARRVAAGPLQAIGQDARPLPRAPGARPPLVLLVVGETARSDHFALNGYPRPTTPELAELGVVSFSAVTACGTSTAASLPCMFSALGKHGFEARRIEQENLLDLAQHAGYAVLWVDNQAGCKGLCNRVPHAQAADPAPGASAPPPAFCRRGECLDDALLFGLDARIDALPAAARERGVLVVLHQMGSHGPAYFRRSPAARKRFLPECTTSVLQQCPRDSVINAYDNSILYTDHVLANAVRWLRDRQERWDGVLAYVSDHGESLGERGLFLHGLPYAVAPREQTRVPMLVWVSPGAERHAGPSMACLGARRGVPLSHDNLFHSVIGLLGMSTTDKVLSNLKQIACRSS